MNKRVILRWTVISAVLLTSIGCAVNGLALQPTDVGELQRESRVVELGGAQEVRANVRMGAGELQIEGGATDLLQAEFIYNVAEWKPELVYEVEDGSGQLTIRQPSTDSITGNARSRYTWELTFNDQVPLDLRIDCGAGSSDIDLSKMALTRLDMRLGAGDSVIDVSDNPLLTRLEFELGAGEVAINLNGTWEQDVMVDIQGGIGQSALQLPNDVGVIVHVTKGLGDIETSGLYRRGDSYVNAAYDEADFVLDITVRTGIGSVVLEVVE